MDIPPMDSLTQEWMDEFGETPPIGWACRFDFHHRWARIHSLPSPKRWPRSAADRREVCRRHNEVATAVLGYGRECILFVSSYFENPEDHVPVSYSGGSGKLPPQPELTRQRDVDDWCGVCATRTTWVPRKFDKLIRDVADDKHPEVLFFCPSNRSVYAPYDGGADFVLPSVEAVLTFKERWADWLSPREDGL